MIIPYGQVWTLCLQPFKSRIGTKRLIEFIESLRVIFCININIVPKPYKEIWGVFYNSIKDYCFLRLL